MLDLSHIRLVDQHAHCLLRPGLLTPAVYLAAFTESLSAEEVRLHAPTALAVRRSLREIADLLGCQPTVEDILRARSARGEEATAALFFERADIAAILLDAGYLPDNVLSPAAHGHYAQIFQLLRIEHLAETLIAEAGTWSRFAERFRAALNERPAGIVGLKSIAAYRTGLDIKPADPLLAAACFEALHKEATAGQPPRVACRALNDWLVQAALDTAAVDNLPVQFHTGYGDPDLDLRAANPLHLRWLIELPAYHHVPFVLLHAGYPYVREAAYLAAVYPNVHVDFGLVIPGLSVAGMVDVLRTLMELAPLSKLLYSSDARLVPESFYLGALWGRRVVARVLEEAVREGDLTVAEAESAAQDMLRGNAVRLYGLPAVG